MSLPVGNTGVAQAADPGQIQPTRDPNLPTPTPPAGWQQRPNLHILLTDQDDQPVGGIQLSVYSYEYNADTGQYDSQKVLEGQTAQGTDPKAGAGWANLDAASIIHGIYHLEMREADGSLILPYDPNGPHYGTGALPAPIDYTTSLLDLSQGDVAYVYQFQVRPLLAGPISQATPYPIPAGRSTPRPTPTLPPAALTAKRAVFFRATEKWIYFPGGAAPLSQVATVTPAPGTTTTTPLATTGDSQGHSGAVNPATTPMTTPQTGNEAGSTNPATPLSAQNPQSSSNATSATDSGPGPFDTPRPVATVGNALVHTGLEVGDTPPPGAHFITSTLDPKLRIVVYDQTPYPTATALPTPTSQYEAQNCGSGCFSTVQAPTATAYAATVWAAMTAGVWTPDSHDAGRNGGLSLPATPPASRSVLTSPATTDKNGGAGAGTVVAGGSKVSNNNKGNSSSSVTGGVSNGGNQAQAQTQADKNRGGGGGDFPWLTLLGIGVGVVSLGLATWLGNRREGRIAGQSTQSTRPTTTTRRQPRPPYGEESEEQGQDTTTPNP